MTLRRLVLGAGVLGALVLVPPAHAAGPPLPSPQSGKAGVVAPGGSERLLARRAGPDTLVLAVRHGEVLRSRYIAGRWTVAPVTLDGAATGVSADGRTLVLVRPARAFPPAATQLAVLDARRLEVRRRISLHAFFTVDAIAPDGRTLYVIQYAGGDVFDYRVRALDTRTGKLAARDIVDPREPDEQMGGLPFTRALSRGGRWVYTLYGGGGETFIHALDTVGRTAACIDLEMFAPDADLSSVRLRLSPDERRVEVRDHGRLVTSVDARPRLPVERKTVAARESGDGLAWLVVIVGAAAAALVAGGARRAIRPPSRAG